jgi:hypothetical protein
VGASEVPGELTVSVRMFQPLGGYLVALCASAALTLAVPKLGGLGGILRSTSRDPANTHDSEWNNAHEGQTPEDAVARLWLSLNQTAAADSA